MRIFFGATLPEETKEQILGVQRMLRAEIPGARFEGKDKLHITLQFIGDFPPASVKPLHVSAVNRLSSVSRMSLPIAITGMNYFPGRKVRRGIWLDCVDDGTLALLSDAVKSASAEFGVVPEEGEFKAHITIARLAHHPNARHSGEEFSRSLPDRGRTLPEDLQKFMGGGKLSVERFYPTSVALFESTLKPSGSEYKILHEYSLEKSEDKLS